MASVLSPQNYADLACGYSREHSRECGQAIPSDVTTLIHSFYPKGITLGQGQHEFDEDFDVVSAESLWTGNGKKHHVSINPKAMGNPFSVKLIRRGAIATKQVFNPKAMGQTLQIDLDFMFDD